MCVQLRGWAAGTSTVQQRQSTRPVLCGVKLPSGTRSRWSSVSMLCGYWVTAVLPHVYQTFGTDHQLAFVTYFRGLLDCNYKETKLKNKVVFNISELKSEPEYNFVLF